MMKHVAFIVRALALAGLTALLMSGLAGADAALMRKQPYLTYAGANTEMTVRWQLTMQESCLIEWGLDTSYSLGSSVTAAYGTDFQHMYTITGLVPGTLYYYRVAAGTEEYTGSFRAAPPAGATSVKFFAYGDCRTYPASHDLVAEDIIAAYGTDPGLQTMIISTGDLTSNGNSEDPWDDEFFNSAYPHIREMMANLPYQSCIGNHEGTGLLFQKYFPYPFVSDRYWSFDYGPVHFAIVDQYVPYGTGSPQLNWLEDDLAATSRPYKIVYLHEPGWSAGGHANNVTVQSVIQPLLVEYGVAILFAGHNHYYARAVVDDIQHVTTGGGGAPLYTPNPSYPYIIATAKAHHFCAVEIDGPTLHFEAIDTAGTVIDSFTVVGPGAGVEDASGKSSGFDLRAPSPGPFRTTTSLSFSAPDPSCVRLEVFDTAGRKVRTLVDGAAGAGRQTVVWDGRDDHGSDVSAGVYFCRLESAGESVARKVVRLK
jgi:hypothetical protein